MRPYSECSELQLKAVDFFCGAGGMSYGLALSGIRILGGIDNNRDCRETYLFNNKPAQFLLRDVRSLSPHELKLKFGIKPDDDNLIFVGCSPCQYWSKINTDKTKSRSGAFLLKEFQKFVEYFRPGYIVIENVPGLHSKKGHEILSGFLQVLQREKYAFDLGVVNGIEFGVPQNRRRFLLLATRRADTLSLPKGIKDKNLTVRNFIGVNNGFPRIRAGHRDTTPTMHTAAALSEKNLKRIELTRVDGGDRSAWKDNPELQIPAYIGKDDSFSDVYARMWWDRPAPTITTRFISFSNGRFGHPEENRALSLREGATLQTFPKDYQFIYTNQASAAKLIGNAVPPALAKKIGKHLVNVNRHGQV